jgi:hypothetical protein
VLGTGQVLGHRGAGVEVDAPDLADEQLGPAQHLPQRDDCVAGFDGARGGLGEQGREQQEVLGGDEEHARPSRPAPAGQQPLEVVGGGGAAEATPDDEDVEMSQAAEPTGGVRPSSS